MATCNDCIHNEICQQFGGTFNIIDADMSCTYFKDRSRFVELPYPLKPKDKVWYILDGLDDLDLKEYEVTADDCAVGNNPDTVVDVGTFGFWVNQLSERNVDVLVPEDCDFINWSEIGVSYFLTREEAEQALKERENEY